MRNFIILLLLMINLPACSNHQLEQTVSKKSALSEKNLVAKWKGKHAQELVAQYGSPDLVIDTTLSGRPATEGYVYETSRLAGNPNCLNVYVVAAHDHLITDYFCR